MVCNTLYSINLLSHSQTRAIATGMNGSQHELYLDSLALTGNTWFKDNFVARPILFMPVKIDIKLITFVHIRDPRRDIWSLEDIPNRKLVDSKKNQSLYYNYLSGHA
ncbi:hypothetical protein PM082_000734 [Marasmius tenuissimus]|nr:hypothetical protein PM082_000734 [Marasmius tenuissimus]